MRVPGYGTVFPFLTRLQQWLFVCRAHPHTRELVLQMPRGPSSLAEVLFHALRARFEGMIGAKATCEDAKAQLQVGDTGTGHTRDGIFSLAWRSEGCVELE